MLMCLMINYLNVIFQLFSFCDFSIIHKTHMRCDKLHMRRCVASIIYRKKMGFVLPWEKWMKKELKDFSYQGLMHLDELNIFNIEEVKNLWKNFLCGSELVPWYKIWSLVILGKWLSVNKENV